MTASSPATRLHDVVVVHDQSRVEWHARTGEIDGGRIVVHASPSPPRGFFANPSGTYTIAALDGGDRARRFASVTLDRGAAKTSDRYVFA